MKWRTAVKVLIVKTVSDAIQFRTAQHEAKCQIPYQTKVVVVAMIFRAYTNYIIRLRQSALTLNIPRGVLWGPQRTPLVMLLANFC